MDELLDVFKILSDETRLRIIILLSKDKLCVCELCAILVLPQPKVSQQLSKLRDLGLVMDERKGQWVFYQLNEKKDVLKEVIDLVLGHSEKYPLLVQDLDRLVNTEKGCKLWT